MGFRASIQYVIVVQTMLMALCHGAVAQINASPPSDRFANLKNQISLFDPLRDDFLRTPSGSDKPTSFGATTAISCAGKEAKINEALAYAFRQLPECNRQIGFEPIAQAVSVLRRARFECANEIQIKGKHGKRSKKARAENHLGHLEGGKWVPNNKDNKYSITLSNEMLKEMPIEEIASTLLHEGLHSTASNHRDWHNDPDDRIDNYSCSSNLFTDRIYFITAACFPMTMNGEALYEGHRFSDPPRPAILNCPALCEAVFSEVDAEAIADLPPSLFANPLPAKTTAEYCRRIRFIGARRIEVKETISKLQNAYFRNWGKLLPEDLPRRMELRDLFADILLYGPDRYFTRGKDPKTSLAAVNAKQSKLKALIGEICVDYGKKGGTLAAFCASGSVRLLSLTNQARLAISSIDPDPKSVGQFVLDQ